MKCFFVFSGLTLKINLAWSRPIQQVLLSKRRNDGGPALTWPEVCSCSGSGKL